MSNEAEHLSELLDQKNDTIDELRGQVEALEQRLRGSSSGWSLPREAPDDDVTPVPRLEFSWNDLSGDWSSFQVEYRLVIRHLLGHLVIVPLGLTSVSSGRHRARPPYESDDELPYRDGAHGVHDGAHLGLPVYRVTPHGYELVRVPPDRRSLLLGREHRREVTP